MSLTGKDFDALQAAILEMNSRRDLKEFRAALSKLMLQLIPADYFAWNELLINPKSGTLHSVDFVESTDGVWLTFAERISRIIYEHPFTKPFLEQPNPTALKFSDFHSLKQLLQTRVYQVAYAPLGFSRQMSIPIWLHPGLVSSLNFSGRGKDFSERDRQMLNRIAPHFKQAYQNAEIATARATALSRPLIAFQFTRSESEIAIWLAEGKSNPEIAAILGLSPRTVEKNVEKMLEKLGVENRTAAALRIAKAN